MREKRQKPLKVRLSLLDRMQLAGSYGRQVDGIWIGNYFSPEHLPRLEAALLLIKQHSPVHYSRIIKDLERIWIYLLPGGLAEYKHSLKACVLDRRYVANSSTTDEDIALTIVHEATHARLERCGIAYTEDRRARIEAVCLRQELAFAARLPGGAQLRDGRARDLNWYQANPDYFRDTQLTERHAKGQAEALRHIGVPEWLVRAMPTLQSIVRGVMRLSRIAGLQSGLGADRDGG